MILKTFSKVRFLLRSRGGKASTNSPTVGLGLGLVQAFHVVERETLCFDKFKAKAIPYIYILRSNCSFSKRIHQLYNEIRQRPCTKPVMDIIQSSALVFNIVKQSVMKMPLTLKQHSVNIVRMCSQQCECVMAHRVRRSQQIFSLYSKMWDEMALKVFIRTWQKQMIRRGKMFLLSAAGVTTVNWDWEMERIADDEIFGHLGEIDFIHMLLKDTMTCNICHSRQVVNTPFPNVTYCQCSSSILPCKKSCHDWLPFIEDEDVLVWRKEERKQHGLYSYKVYGSYKDVSAKDFLEVQLDINLRKEWDATAVQLNLIDSDPKTNSDVVYWELKWPRLFANRDYVFNRRYIVDEEKKIMLVVNRGTTHPSCPDKPGNHRVVDYWSFMIIRPYTDFNEPGLEFGLTYFDNPGINIPSAVTAWVAYSGLPQYLARMRQAARDVGCNGPSGETSNPDGHNKSKGTSQNPEPNPSPPSSDNLPANQETLGKHHDTASDDLYIFQQFNLRKLFL